MTKKTNGGDIDLDNILVEIGQFGFYQISTFLLILFPVMFSALAASEYIFTAGDLSFRCHIPECDGDITDNFTTPTWFDNAVPEGSRCERYAVVPGASHASCPATMFDPNTVMSCEKYIHETSNTIVYDFDMHCQDWKRTLIGTLRSVGTLIVLPFTGFISDRWGRRTALIINAFNTALFGLIRSWSTSYEMYLVLSVIEPSVGAGAFSSCFMIATEMLGPKIRPLGGVMMSTGFALGQTALGLLAWAFPDWRTLTRVLYGPQFIVIVYFWVLSESVRWLLSKGKFVQAERVLKRAARMNGRSLSEKSLENLNASAASVNNIPDDTSVDSTPKPSLFKQVIRSKVILRRICTTPVWWISTTLIYYGLSINAVGLSGNMYINFILVSVIEIPGYFTAFFTLNLIGRKPSLCFSFLACGICNFAFPFIPEDLSWLSLIVYLMGKFFISMTFTSIYVYTAELFPTESRHSLHAFSSMVGRIGSITAPQTPLLIPIWRPFPTTIFGAMAVISGLLVLTMPETKGTKLPDTIEEAENVESLKANR